MVVVAGVVVVVASISSINSISSIGSIGSYHTDVLVISVEYEKVQKRGRDETESCRQKLPLSLVLICFPLSQLSSLDRIMMGVGGTICDAQLERRMLQTVSECRGREYSYASASNLTSWIFLHLSRSPKAHLSQAGMSRSEIGQ